LFHNSRAPMPTLDGCWRRLVGPDGWTGPLGAVGPSPRRADMPVGRGMARCGRFAMGGINQTGRSRRASSGIMTRAIRAHPRARGCSRRCRGDGQAADVVVGRPKNTRPVSSRPCRRCGEDHSVSEHRRGMIAPVGGRGLFTGSGVRRTPVLIWGARPRRVRRRDGDRVVSTGCGRSLLGGCPARGPAATGLPGAGVRV
jgi:hypothetical protein